MSTNLIVFNLTGTKADLRVMNSDKYVTTAEGKKLKNKIGAYTLVECSAKKKTNLANVFEEAIRSVVKPVRKECNIL